MSLYSQMLDFHRRRDPMLAVLVDPDKFDPRNAERFIASVPDRTTHIFVGGSTVEEGMTETVVEAIKSSSDLPVVLFPGDHSQITPQADALLFLSLLSGRNPEYLIGQQVKAVARLNGSPLEIISTAYLLIDGDHLSAVERVTGTPSMSQDNVEAIVHTARAGELMGAKLCYLEAGSGARIPVAPKVISAVRQSLEIPLIVGGGVRTSEQLEAAYAAGAGMVVMGTHFESN